MAEELEKKLAEIKTEIAQLDADKELTVEYYAGRRWTLENMKDWLEGMIANYCE